MLVRPVTGTRPSSVSVFGSFARASVRQLAGLALVGPARPQRGGTLRALRRRQLRLDGGLLSCPALPFCIRHLANHEITRGDLLTDLGKLRPAARGRPLLSRQSYKMQRRRSPGSAHRGKH